MNLKKSLLFATLGAAGAWQVAEAHDHGPGSASRYVKEQFHVRSFASADAFQSKSGIAYGLRIAFDVKASKVPVYEASVDGYRLNPFLVVDASRFRQPDVASATLVLKEQGDDARGQDFLFVRAKSRLDQTDAGDIIYLSKDGQTVAVGSFRDVVDPKEPYKTHEYPALCEGEYSAVCRITLTTTVDTEELSQTQLTPFTVSRFPRVEANLRLELNDSETGLNLSNKNF